MRLPPARVGGSILTGLALWNAGPEARSRRTSQPTNDSPGAFAGMPVGGHRSASRDGAGLFHRDVKPANILLEGEGDECRAYLTDFSIGKRFAERGEYEETAPTALTQSGEIIGCADSLRPCSPPGHGAPAQ